MKFRFRKMLNLVLVASLLLWTGPTFAQEPAAAPSPDAALDELVKMDPAAIVAHLQALREQAAAQRGEAAKLRADADALDGQAAGMAASIDALGAHMAALAAILGTPAPAAADAAMAAAPAADAAMMAAETAEAKKEFVNFDEHVKPILQSKCFRCHSDDSKKGGLSLTSHAAAMAGGGSGEVIKPGDPDGSRLLRVIMHTEEPVMPPSGDKLPDDQIDVIRRWIADGALANAGSTPVAKKEEAAAMGGEAFVAAEIVDGPPPMPEVTLAVAKRLPTRGVVARAVDTNPRSALMAVGGDREVVLYNMETYQNLGALPFPEGDIYTLSFSVNGELLAAGGGEEGNSGAAVVWNVRKGERVGTFGEAYDTVLAVDLSPDHKMIATGGPDKKVRVYSTENGAELYKLDPHTDWITAVKFTPDGEVLASADRQGGMYLWQAKNGRTVEQLKGHEGAIYAIEYTYDSKYLVSSGHDGTVREWDTWTYQQVRSFKAHNAPVTNVDVAQDGRLITTSNDQTTKAWNFDGTAIRDYAGLVDWGYQVRFGQGGQTVLAGTWTGDVLLWKADTGELLKTLNTNPAS